MEVEAEELSSGGKNVHNITVTVKDMHGGVHVSEVIIYINELPRIVIFEPEDGSSFGSGEEVSFDASLSSDAEDGTSDYLYFVWYYDDGSGPQPFGQGAISSRTFRTTGDYVVTVEVTDSAGGMSEKSISININSKPIAEIGNVKGSGKELTFDGSGSSDPDGKDIDRYVWDMDLSFDSDGDGEADNDRDAEGVSPTFKFNDTGTYNIQLTVMDEDGVWSDPVTLEVKVKEEEDDALPPAMIFMSVALAALVMSIQRKRR